MFLDHSAVGVPLSDALSMWNRQLLKLRSRYPFATSSAPEHMYTLCFQTIFTRIDSNIQISKTSGRNWQFQSHTVREHSLEHVKEFVYRVAHMLLSWFSAIFCNETYNIKIEVVAHLILMRWAQKLINVHGSRRAGDVSQTAYTFRHVRGYHFSCRISVSFGRYEKRSPMPHPLCCHAVCIQCITMERFSIFDAFSRLISHFNRSINKSVAVAPCQLQSTAGRLKNIEKAVSKMPCSRPWKRRRQWVNQIKSNQISFNDVW